MSKKNEPRRMDIRVLPIADLNPAVYNPRVELKPGMPEYDKLKLGIETFGLVEPLVVNERTGWTIVGGHQRYNILKARGDTEVECSVVDLPESAEKTLNVSLNKLTGSWQYDSLSTLLAELSLSDIDVSLTGFDFDPESFGEGLGSLEETTATTSELMTELMTKPTMRGLPNAPDIQGVGDQTPRIVIVCESDDQLQSLVEALGISWIPGRVLYRYKELTNIGLL